MRKLNEQIKIEDSEEEGSRSFRVPSNDAFLELDNAVSHLHHFCATLPAKEYVDLRPDFICYPEGNLVRARVILPLSVNASVRTAESLSAWKSEKNAIKDVSFQAYLALYHAGLISDNLLPFKRHDVKVERLEKSSSKEKAGILEVDEQLNPWIVVAKQWIDVENIWQSTVSVGDLEMHLYLPIKLPAMNAFRLYWDHKTELLVDVAADTIFGDNRTLEQVKKSSYELLKSTYSRRFTVEQDQHVLLFTPTVDNIPVHSISITDPEELICKAHVDSNSIGIIHNTLKTNSYYQYNAYLSTKPELHDVQRPYDDYPEKYNDEPHLSVQRLPKRYNFLHKFSPAMALLSSKLHSAVLPISKCEVDNVPFQYTRFGLLLPSIMHRFGIYLLTEELSTTILKNVEISNLELVVTAICASAAQESTNYQRLEFLGDAVLKLCTSIQLFAEFPLWHEGLLSMKKDRIVSNHRLAGACIHAGLDKFIITKRFARKWRPLYVNELIEESKLHPRRQVSSKTLADVVEALIGAAAVDGGIPKALKCLSTFLPEVKWKNLLSSQLRIYEKVPEMPSSSILESAESLLGYTFNKKALLVEALTHASLTSSTCGSLERLEFLGDAILDHIIVFEMWDYNLSHTQMHTLRTAMVNADFHAWICLESSFDVEISSITQNQEAQSNHERWCLWRYLRHSSSALSRSQQETVRRHRLLRDRINEEISTGKQYPWALLGRLNAPKFFSDMIESLLGAVWIDSCESSDAPTIASANLLNSDSSFLNCRRVLEKLGVMKYLHRILKDQVHALHPKEELRILADEKTVEYVLEDRKFGITQEVNLSREPLSPESSDEEEVDGQEGTSKCILVKGMTEYLCKVLVGDEVIVSIDGGISKMEVMTRAAGEAVKLLKDRSTSSNVVAIQVTEA